MTWVEIISIRTAGIGEAKRVFEIGEQMFQTVAVEGLLKLTLYSNARYPTDLAFHLQWQSDPGLGSVLGGEVSAALRNLGLVSHTVWLERETALSSAASTGRAGRKAVNAKPRHR